MSTDIWAQIVYNHRWHRFFLLISQTQLSDQPKRASLSGCRVARRYRRRGVPQTRYISQLVQQYPLLRDDIVPKAAKADFTAEVAALRTFVGARKNLVAITGAGLSTESGLPDYRSPNGSYSKGHKPTTIQEFGASERSRIRFWARSFEGWMTFSNASPNRGHLALAALESNGPLRTIITQNVDGLHQKAGSKSVIELHGSLHQVKCMDCGSFHDRIQFQTHLAQLNPEWYRGLLERHQKREQLYVYREHQNSDLSCFNLLFLLTIQKAKHSNHLFNWVISGTLARADGDVALELDFEKFKVPACYTCGGRLQPGVVMFGDNVPPAVTQSARAAVEVADGILVAGTSLQVFSAYKWILQARERKIPVVIINIGPTRGDSEAELKIEHRLGDILPQIFRNESQL